MLLGLAVAAAAAVGGVAAFAYNRWSCPSQAELERPRSADEVVDTFADHGVELEPTALPLEVVSDYRAYRAASAYRYVSPRATLYVLVCKQRCVDAPGDVRAVPVVVAADMPPQRVRQFSTLGNNIASFATDNDGHSARKLTLRLVAVFSELDTAVSRDSHCYVQ